MNKLALTLVAIVGISVVGLSASSAEAKKFGKHFGVHVSGNGYHFGIGSSHHNNSFQHGTHGFYGGAGWGGGHQWHDTSHYEVVPGYYVWNGDHYDYVPPRTIYHNSGHVTNLHW